jgi:soluble P-type ATPase
MIRLEIPGRKTLEIEHLILDYNGTVACNGVLYEGIEEKLAKLAEAVKIHVITADTYGSVHAQCTPMGVAVHVIGKEAQDEAKRTFIGSLGKEGCVAIGNGRNDALMLSDAALGFALIQEEGLSTRALMASDVVFGSIHDALDALLSPQRLIATLRN